MAPEIRYRFGPMKSKTRGFTRATEGAPKLERGKDIIIVVGKDKTLVKDIGHIHRKIDKVVTWPGLAAGKNAIHRAVSVT